MKTSEFQCVFSSLAPIPSTTAFFTFKFENHVWKINYDIVIYLHCKRWSRFISSGFASLRALCVHITPFAPFLIRFICFGCSSAVLRTSTMNSPNMLAKRLITAQFMLSRRTQLTRVLNTVALNSKGTQNQMLQLYFQIGLILIINRIYWSWTDCLIRHIICRCRDKRPTVLFF